MRLIFDSNYIFNDLLEFKYVKMQFTHSIVIFTLVNINLREPQVDYFVYLVVEF